MESITLDDITYGTTGWNGLAQSNFEKIEAFINTDLWENALILADSAEINCQTTTKQTIFTVPSGKLFIPVYLVVHSPSASLAGMTDFDLGAGTNADDWLQQISLDSFTATTDYGILMQPEQDAGPPIVPIKKTIYSAGAEWGVKITTGSSSAATAVFDLFGYLIDN